MVDLLLCINFVNTLHDTFLLQSSSIIKNRVFLMGSIFCVDYFCDVYLLIYKIMISK